MQVPIYTSPEYPLLAAIALEVLWVFKYSSLQFVVHGAADTTQNKSPGRQALKGEIP